jgi:hypothetical protein
MTKPLQVVDLQGFVMLLRGHMRIRTAVAAFAELCLTTRLCDLNFLKRGKDNANF